MLTKQEIFQILVTVESEFEKRKARNQRLSAWDEKPPAHVVEYANELSRKSGLPVEFFIPTTERMFDENKLLSGIIEKLEAMLTEPDNPLD